MLNKKALAGTAGAPKEYVEDVFSTWLYKGTGSTQTITNGIDLAGKGGLVWLKDRTSSTRSHGLFDTNRGVSKVLNSNNTDSEQFVDGINQFNANGFQLVAGNEFNASEAPLVSWTFRKAKKFFDVVTWTGNDGGQRTINHNINGTVGMVILRPYTSSTNWRVWHRYDSTKGLRLNLTDAASANDFLDSVGNTSITVPENWNVGGTSYVAYLFAHDAGGFGDAGTDNIISCGSYTGTGADGLAVTLGYEPQYVLIKNASSTGNWVVLDIMRGMPDVAQASILYANVSDSELNYTDSKYVIPTATGFRIDVTANAFVNQSGNTYIYMAIRRPMKVPTSGTEVFSPTVYTGTNADNRLINTGILTDMVMLKERNDTVAGMVVGDRLRGNPYLLTGSTAAEVNDADSLMTPTSGYGNAFSAMNGVGVGNDATSKVNIDTTSNNHIAWAFKRARKFFDIVCYTGTGSARTVTHNLGVVPELIIVKRRNGTSFGIVYSATLGETKYLMLVSSDKEYSDTYWNNTAPTNSVFSLDSLSDVNASGGTYVAYLFASVNGVSKVGSYTGNGSNQTINCGFSAGARFVLIKRTDSNGDWYVFDTARGIVSGNDPFLLLNSTNTEVTTRDAVDPDNSGFIVNNDATNFPINVNNATYIYLAIA